MSIFVITAILAIMLVLGAMALLGISYLLQGRLSWKLGSCGKHPKNIRDKNSCSNDKSSCSLCSNDIDKSKKNDENGSTTDDNVEEK